jgi:hypothetical protein
MRGLLLCPTSARTSHGRGRAVAAGWHGQRLVTTAQAERATATGAWRMTLATRLVRVGAGGCTQNGRISAATAPGCSVFGLR